MFVPPRSLRSPRHPSRSTRKPRCCSSDLRLPTRRLRQSGRVRPGSPSCSRRVKLTLPSFIPPLQLLSPRLPIHESPKQHLSPPPPHLSSPSPISHRLKTQGVAGTHSSSHPAGPLPHRHPFHQARAPRSHLSSPAALDDAGRPLFLPADAERGEGEKERWEGAEGDREDERGGVG